MPHQNKIDSLIEQCINELADDSIDKGAESLAEFAQYWSKAGLPFKQFLEMRKFIVDQASEKTDSKFIKEKLEVAEKKAREKRTGSIIIH